jgi:two-component system, OmpR family, sensor histidine kinase KdpD
VFFGATAGVGKTYAMLAEARQRRDAGTDVVVGVVETHGRAETERLLGGLEVLPRRTIAYQSVTLHELDLAAALERAPGLLLIDELAHTNAPGSLHQKRWQDVEELLEAGLDVWTTLNVQHIESLNDVVARITHVRVRETVPDRIVEGADEVALVDLPPDELLRRLREGKVYVPEQIARAQRSFFRRGNLIALRQLALRYTAGHVDDAMRSYRRAFAVQDTWPVAERILVGVGPSPSSTRLVRATKRLADRLGAQWMAVFVETPAYAGWPEADRQRVWETLRLARELGAETSTIGGVDTSALLDYARKHNVTRIVVGKPRHARWRDRLFGSLLDQVIRESGDTDIFLTTGDEAGDAPTARPQAPTRRPSLASWTLSVAAVAACTVVATALRDRIELANLIMLYLLTLVGVAAHVGRGPSVLASVLSVAAFDWFCVPPFNTFAVHDTVYLPVFGVMLVLGLVISTLTARLRDQAEASRQREWRTSALLAASRELTALNDPQRITEVAVRHIAATFEAAVRILAPDAFGRLRDLGSTSLKGPSDEPVAAWVLEHRRAAGRGTGTLPDAARLYLPLGVGDGVAGVLEVGADHFEQFRNPERMQLLETFAAQTAAALERVRLADAGARAEHLSELSRLKSEFVAVASHEIKNPLNTLGLAVELLAERFNSLDDPRGQQLLGAATHDVARLRELAGELLDLSRLEARHVELDLGELRPDDVVREVADAARLRAEGTGTTLVVEVPDVLPTLRADAVHLRRALANLVDNALRHAPAGGRVVVGIDTFPEHVQFSVADDGPGVPLRDQERIFEPFVGGGDRAGSAGLGLAIARQIVRAHGGDIWVDSGPGPGAVFSFTIPLTPAALSPDTADREAFHG